jgi:hypothetical protein
MKSDECLNLIPDSVQNRTPWVDYTLRKITLKQRQERKNNRRGKVWQHSVNDRKRNNYLSMIPEPEIIRKKIDIYDYINVEKLPCKTDYKRIWRTTQKKKVLLSLNKTSGSHTIVYSFGLQFSDFCLCTRDDVQPSPQPILEHFHYLKKKT